MFAKEISNHLMIFAEKLKFNRELVNQVLASDTYQKYALKGSQAFLNFSNGIVGASLALDIFWSIIFLTNLSVLAMSGLVVFVAFSTVALGIGTCWKYTYQRNKAANQLNKRLENELCKEAVYQEVLARKQRKVAHRMRNLIENIMAIAEINHKTSEIMALFEQEQIILSEIMADPKRLLMFAAKKNILRKMMQEAQSANDPLIKIKFPSNLIKNETELKSINRKSKLLKTIIEGISITGVIFGSFFAGAVYMFTGLGLANTAAMLSNPAVIGVVFSFAALYGVYYSYLTYQFLSDQAQLKNVIRLKEGSNEQYKDECHYFESLSQTLKHAASSLYVGQRFNKPSERVQTNPERHLMCEKITVSSSLPRCASTPRF